MSEQAIVTIAVAALGFLSTVASVFVTQRFAYQSRLLDHRKWVLDRLRQERYEAIQRLYMAFLSAQEVLNRYGNFAPQKLAEYRSQVEPRVDRYRRALVRAKPYLTPEIEEELRPALGAFRQASMAIFLSLPDEECPLNKLGYDECTRQLDWSHFSVCCDNAERQLHNLVCPPAQKKLLGELVNNQE